MTPMFPDSAVHGEMITEILFLQAFSQATSQEAARERFFSDLSPRSELVPAFGRSSDTWEDFLEECIETRFLSRNGVVTLTLRGKAHLEALIEEASQRGMVLAS